MIELRRILVPTDFSQHSHKALTYATALAEKFGAEITLLHVVQDLALFLPDSATGAAPIVPPTEQLTGPIREALTRIVTENGLDAAKVREEVREGTPYVEIVSLAREANIDLIILGTHGRGGLAHMLLGSVAERVVRAAPCPVLTVRDPEHEFVHP